MTAFAPTRTKSRLRPRDAVAVGAIGLRVRRGRTLLTALGIAIGIAAMVAVVGISASSRADLLDELDRLGTNLLEVTPGQSFFGEDSKLPEESTAMINRIAPVDRASAVASVSATVRRSDKISESETGGIAIKAADTTLLDTLQATMHTGRFLDAATEQYPTVVLGATAAEVLGIDRVDGNIAVYISGQWFTVIGILDPVELVPSIDRSALIGFPVAQDVFGIDGSASIVYVRTDPESVDAVCDVLPATANPEAPNEVEVTRPSDALEARAATDEALTALLLGLGGVALLVGGVGIANVMIISVLERRGEIGVRRALGATRRHIRLQFVIESSLMSLLGGATGLAIGAVVTAVYAHNRGWRLDLPLEALAGGVLVALAVGAIAGLYPAARAARLPPAEAVRPAVIPPGSRYVHGQMLAMDVPRTIVRKAERHELAALIEVERRSSVRFAAVAGLESWADDTTDLDELGPAVEAELVWAAEADGGELVGWCYASVADDSLFVEQIDVVPEFGRQGIGRRILAAVGDEAAARGLVAVTLTTDAHVPWNRPWYESIGFVVVAPEAQAPGLAAHIASEAARGFDMARRVAMRRDGVVRTPG